MTIKINPTHKGALHRALHVKQGDPIPTSRLEKAKDSPNKHVAQMANFALNARSWKHK